MVKENICCNCNELSSDTVRINGEKNYYCMKCVAKINESGMDYWKECSFGEFLGKISKDIPDSETPFADHFREVWKEMGHDVTERKRRKRKKTK